MAKFIPDEGAFYRVTDLEEEGLAKKETIHRWIRAGKLQASTVGKNKIVSGVELKRFMARGTIASEL